jgi:hypothetical protein
VCACFFFCNYGICLCHLLEVLWIKYQYYREVVWEHTADFSDCPMEGASCINSFHMYLYPQHNWQANRTAHHKQNPPKSQYSAFWSSTFLSSKDHVCLNLFMIVWIISLFGAITFWNLCQNLLLTFHMDVIHEHLCQCARVTWHFDTRSNSTDGTFDTIAGAWDCGRQAHDA